MFSSLSLITAVAVALQANPARPAPKHAPRSEILRTPAALETMAAELGQLGATAPALAQGDAELAAVGAQLAGLEGLQGLAGLEGLEGLSGLQGLEGLASLEVLDASAPVLAGSELATEPRAPWADQDPGDSLYRAARQQLNRSRYADAARLFTDLINRYERSSYTPDAYYWAAFALYRTGEDASLQQAVTLLDKQKSKYARAATIGDNQELLARVLGVLARRGNQDAARRLRELAGPDTATTTSRGGSTTACPNEDDDPRVAALMALNQMDPETAVPILKGVLKKRDPCSTELRRKAVFVLSQKRTSETEDILLDVARNDPDSDVRQQAVFWLSQVGTEKALTALDSIARTSKDEDLLEKALFAISQIHSPHAVQALRDFALRDDAPEDARERAVFWIGQSHDPGNGEFLRDLYGRVTNEDLKEKIIFSISQMHSAENTRWLMDLALNQKEDIEVRKKALFWAGQSGADLTDLVQLYERTTDQDMKEQLIFVYSQRHEPAAIDKMIDIAQHETNPELRKKAIFWLGQSHDPKAAKALLEIINQ